MGLLALPTVIFRAVRRSDRYATSGSICAFPFYEFNAEERSHNVIGTTAARRGMMVAVELFMVSMFSAAVLSGTL